jgi:hypothetical protein
MLSVAFALVLSQTPVADKARTLHDAANANCPSNPLLEASNPAIALPEIGTDPRTGFPDMVHMPPVAFIYALDQRVNGCFTPKFVNGPRTIIEGQKAIIMPAKPDASSGPGVR